MNEAIASLHWYQQGYWPLIGAMAGLVFTNLAGMAAIAYQSHRAHMNYLRSNAIDLLHRRLNEFYDPLYSLLLTNSRTFREVGPQSFPDDHIRREAAAEIWQRIRSEVIIPNNLAIANVVKEKCHLIAPNDNITEYMQLLIHISMYNVFQDTPTELYAKFEFPKNILRHVEEHRDRLIAELNNQYGKLK